MADLVRFIERAGTPIVWGQPGASGVTNNMTLNNLASAAGRGGVYADLGADWDCDLLVEAQMESGTAPTAGLAVDVWLIFSSTTTGWPAGLTGADEALTVANVNQLGLPALQVISIASANAILRQAPVRIRARGRYVAAATRNGWNVGLRNEGTAIDHDSRITVTPIRTVGIG